MIARTLATAGRVLRQLGHDPRSIILMLVAPSLLVGLFAWLFSDQDGVFDRVGGPILALFPFVVMFLITSITTLRERRSGTLERLMTTPLGKADFIAGYALAFGLMAVLQAVVTVAFAVLVCGLDVDGPLWQLGLVAVVDAPIAHAANVHRACEVALRAALETVERDDLARDILEPPEMLGVNSVTPNR